MTQQIKRKTRSMLPASEERDLNESQPKKTMGRMEKILQEQAQRNVLRPSTSTFRYGENEHSKDAFAFSR